MKNAPSNHGPRDPFWYKNAIIYELHVRSFFDTNSDGIGDFPGLTQKLDYLADLGVTALWLLPFYPSPQRDGGYDISDYVSIDPNYGTMRDWRTFLREAHRRGLRVITELVLNHTSDQHEWFQKSRRAPPGSHWRNYYVWTDNPEKYKQARVIFKDFEPSNWTWDPLAKAYYWHRFYSHQPDLNFESAAVRRAIFKVLDFWFDQGVDGFRLDAVPYLYERENTSCENLPETHQFLKTLRRHVDQKYKNRVLLAEANQWPEEAVNYFGEGDGDECQMAFHFPLMPRLFMGIRMEDRVPIIDIMNQTPPLPEAGQWALFLRNHDELTLEMVTDEERDYMYRVYAGDVKARINLGIRRRLAPLLGNDRKTIELLNLLLFSMPGTPVLYYGDEIGMGDNIYLGDRHGVRTPMHWNSDKNAGFSRARPQSLPLPVVVESEYHYESVNVEAQQGNRNSLLWWTKRLISLRKRWKAFGRGTLEFIPAGNRKVLAFLRSYDDECVLVVANLSHLAQPARLMLPNVEGASPVELFGGTDFPEITAEPYAMTLSPHSAFWFWLRPPQKREGVKATGKPAEIVVNENWMEVLSEPLEGTFARAIQNFLQQQSWFTGRGRVIENIMISDVVIPPNEGSGCLAIADVEYRHHEREEYLVLLAFASGAAADEIRGKRPESLIAEVQSRTGPGVLYDGIACGALMRELLSGLGKRRSWKGSQGECRIVKSRNLAALPSAAGDGKMILINRSNTSLVWDDSIFFKLFRKLEPGVNPEIEITRYLAGKAFQNVPPLLGVVEYRSRLRGDVFLGAISRVVPEGENAWLSTQSALELYFERTEILASETAGVTEPSSEQVAEAVGAYSEFARLLGQRTGELHQALVDPEIKDFAPESFTPFYLRSLYQSIRNHVTEALNALSAGGLEPETQSLASKLLARKTEMLGNLQSVYRSSPQGVRIRCHGTYQLTEVLSTGKDFYVIDFEGDPTRPISERRIKRPAVYDLAKMIWSFHLAVHSHLQNRLQSVASQKDHGALEAWANAWARWVSKTFLNGYLGVIDSHPLLAQSRVDFKLLLKCHLVDRAARELLTFLKEAAPNTRSCLLAWLQILDRWNG